MYLITSPSWFTTFGRDDSGIKAGMVSDSALWTLNHIYTPAWDATEAKVSCVATCRLQVSWLDTAACAHRHVQCSVCSRVHMVLLSCSIVCGSKTSVYTLWLRKETWGRSVLSHVIVQCIMWTFHGLAWRHVFIHIYIYKITYITSYSWTMFKWSCMGPCKRAFIALLASMNHAMQHTWVQPDLQRHLYSSSKAQWFSRQSFIVWNNDRLSCKPSSPTAHSVDRYFMKHLLKTIAHGKTLRHHCSTEKHAKATTNWVDMFETTLHYLGSTFP